MRWRWTLETKIIRTQIQWRKSIDEMKRRQTGEGMSASLAHTAHLLFMNIEQSKCFAKNLWRSALVYFFVDFFPIANIFLCYCCWCCYSQHIFCSNDDGKWWQHLTFGYFSNASSLFHIYFVFITEVPLSWKKNTSEKKRARIDLNGTEREWVAREDTLMAHNDESMNCREMWWSLAEWRNSFLHR